MAGRGKHNTGTAKGVAVWYRQQRWTDTSAVELFAMPLEGQQLVASWTIGDVRADVERWTTDVDELATSDATGRDTTTRYELRHVDEAGKVRGTSHLRRVVAEEVDEAGEVKPTGDLLSINVQLQKSLERANAQVIESSRVATQTAAAAIEAQKASLVMLSQAYTLIGGLQASNVELHADKLDAKPAPAQPSAGDEAFRELIKIIGPKVAMKLLENMED